jgi:ankyrin repeat protein
MLMKLTLDLHREIGFLLQLGEDVNQTNKNRNTPLHFAASKGHLSTVKFLVEHGAKVCLHYTSYQAAVPRQLCIKNHC